MAGASVVSPFGSKVVLSPETADRLTQYGYEAEKKTTRASSTKTADKSSDGK